MEMPLTARNVTVVRVNAPFTRVGFYVLEAFGNCWCEKQKKKGLCRIIRLEMLVRLP